MDLKTRTPEQLKNKYYVIPYLPVTPRVGMIGMALSPVVALMALIAMILAKVGFLGPHAFALAIPFLSMSALIGVGLVLFESILKKRISIEVCDEGIIFPFMFRPDLLFRTTRPWNDIANIMLGSMLLHDSKGAYEYDLEQSKDSRRLFIYFKSGGHATIDLNRMSKKGQELLFVALESWCLQFSRSPQLRADRDDDSRFLPGKETLSEREPPKSFTELWEQDMQDHFSATNFVPLSKGKLLREGRLRILMQLAAGGLSSIYLAETPDRELRVVKEATLPPRLDPQLKAKAQEMFTREATILQRLQHPKIARVLDYFIEENRDYLVLEFVPGHTLRQIVRQSGPIQEEKVLRYAQQIADILEYLHSEDPPIVHRDITPDNLVLREDGEIVLIDFGAANEFLGTATGTLVGKQAYIAPEQFRGKAHAKSDIYALGGSMHFMLTGKDPEALSSSHPRSVNPEVSPGVDALVAECTEEELSNRVESATILYDKIEHLLETGGGAVISTIGAGNQSTN